MKKRLQECYRGLWESFSSSERAQQSGVLGGHGILELGTVCVCKSFGLTLFPPNIFFFF